MKCFYHHEQDTVAVCKSCQRGLCPDCAADVGNGVACRGRCVGSVHGMEISSRDLRALVGAIVPQSPGLTGLFYLALGLALMVLPLLFVKGAAAAIFGFLPVVLFYVGVWLLVKAWRMLRIRDELQENKPIPPSLMSD